MVSVTMSGFYIDNFVFRQPTMASYTTKYGCVVWRKLSVYANLSSYNVN